MADLLTVRTQQFNQAMAELQRNLAQPRTMKQIVDSEVTSILTATIKKTKKATTQTIINSFDSRPPWRTYDGKKYKLTNHYPNALWASIQEKMAKSLAAKLAAKAFAAQVWYKLGLRVGPVQASSDVISAKKQNVDNSINGSVQKQEQANVYAMVIQNTSPLIRFSDSRQAIFGAIAGRTTFFKRNLATGVFNTMEATLKKYPGFKLEGPK